MPEKKPFVVLIATFILISLFVVNYSYLDKQLTEFLRSSDTVRISRIIDGDTVVSGYERIRLLGINTPERGEQYYQEAKDFLDKAIFNKSVVLAYGKTRKDRYGRTLAYIFLNNTNINKQLVEQGLANIYFPQGKDRYYNDFLHAWKECVALNKNLCKHSEKVCAKCIKLKNLDAGNEEVYLRNSCNLKCDLTNWTIKDEGRKKFIFGEFVLMPYSIALIKVGEGKNTSTTLFWSRYKSVWTDTGDTLFLRDDENNLVLWKSY